MKFVGRVGHSYYRTPIHCLGIFSRRHSDKEEVPEDWRYGCQHAFVHSKQTVLSLNHKVAIVKPDVGFPEPRCEFWVRKFHMIDSQRYQQRNRTAEIKNVGQDVDGDKQ